VGDGTQMAIFCVLYFQRASRSTFQTHSKFALRPHRVSKYATAVIRQGKKKERTRMWDNAQPDGRPAEYRRRPLFNAAKFGWRPHLECRTVTLHAKTRNTLKFAGVLQTPEPISAASGPKFTILW